MFEIEHIERDESRMDETDHKLVALMDEIESEVAALGQLDAGIFDEKKEEPVALTLEKDDSPGIRKPRPLTTIVVKDPKVKIVRTTHNIGVTERKTGTALGIEGLVKGGNGNGAAKKKKPLWKEVTQKETLVALPDGALSVEADVVPKDQRIFIFEWPTMVYVGYDVNTSADDYEDYLVMFYRPKMKVAFGNKLAIDVPSSAASISL